MNKEPEIQLTAKGLVFFACTGLGSLFVGVFLSSMFPEFSNLILQGAIMVTGIITGAFMMLMFKKINPNIGNSLIKEIP